MYMYSALYDDTFSDEPNRSHAILYSKPVCKIGWNYTSFMPTIKRKSVKEDDIVRLLLSLSQMHLHIYMSFHDSKADDAKRRNKRQGIHSDLLKYIKSCKTYQVRQRQSECTTFRCKTSFLDGI